MLHGLVPPHPGPLVAITTVKADLGVTLALGLLVAVPTVIVAGPLFGRLAARWVDATPPTALMAELDEEKSDEEAARRPTFGLTVGTVLPLVVLMLGKAIADVRLDEGSTVRTVLDGIGTPLFALLVAVLVAMFTLGRPAGFGRKRISAAVAESLPPIAGILLIVGAGGGFKQTLIDAGVGKTITQAANGAHFSALLLGRLVAVGIRPATGSATLATISAAGIRRRHEHVAHGAARPGHRVGLAVLLPCQRRGILAGQGVLRDERRPDDQDLVLHGDHHLGGLDGLCPPAEPGPVTVPAGKASPCDPRPRRVLLTERPSMCAERIRGRPTMPHHLAEDRLRGVLGTGEPLGGRLRSALERAYGADLGRLRIHTGETGDRIARAFAAEAVTIGADLFFASGAYAPGSRAGLELLAHEVAHAVGQSGPRLPCTAGASVSSPGDACEAEADSLARGFARGAVTPGLRRVRTLEDSEQLVAQRHASWEHRLLGDALPADLDAITKRAADRPEKLEELRDFLEMWREDPDGVTPEAIKARHPGIRTLRLGGSGLLVTYGELNTLADYLADPAALDAQPKRILEPLLQAVRQESFHHVTRLLGGGRKGRFENSVVANTGWGFADLLLQSMALDRLTEGIGPNGVDHYGAVVGRNACHFAPGSWYRWEQYHLIARDHAEQAYYARDAAHRERLAYLAWINHGYADHFLHDSFAAGHLINKTLVMQWFVEWAATGLGRLMPVADWKMVKTMTSARQGGLAARGLYDGFLDPSRRPLARDPQTADEQWSARRRMDVAGVTADGTRSQADAYKHYLTFVKNAGVQVSSGVLHDHYTRTGLTVASAAHPAPFEIYGDCTMMDGGDGVRIASETAHLSQASIGELIDRGTTGITTAQIFNRFPTLVRQGDAMLTLEQWNDAQRGRAEKLFRAPKIAAIRAAVTRIPKISRDVAGGWRWESCRGEATDIAVGGDGVVWAISRTPAPDKNGCTVQRLRDGLWEPMGGAGTRIAVDGAGTAWTVDGDGAIRRRDGGAWTPVTCDGIPVGVSAAGEPVSGASDIGAGADGSVWVTGRAVHGDGHPVLRWNGARWERAEGSAVAVSVAPTGLPWIAGGSGAISRMRTGGPLGSGWSALPGSAADIAVSTGVAPAAWTAGSGGIHAWNGLGWDRIRGRAARIAAGPDGTPWTVDADGAVRHLVPADVSRVAFSTPDGGATRGRVRRRRWISVPRRHGGDRRLHRPEPGHRRQERRPRPLDPDGHRQCLLRLHDHRRRSGAQGPAGRHALPEIRRRARHGVPARPVPVRPPASHPALRQRPAGHQGDPLGVRTQAGSDASASASCTDSRTSSSPLRSSRSVPPHSGQVASSRSDIVVRPHGRHARRTGSMTTSRWAPSARVPSETMMNAWFSAGSLMCSRTPARTRARRTRRPSARRSMAFRTASAIPSSCMTYMSLIFRYRFRSGIAVTISTASPAKAAPVSRRFSMVPSSLARRPQPP